MNITTAAKVGVPPLRPGDLVRFRPLRARFRAAEDTAPHRGYADEQAAKGPNVEEQRPRTVA